MTAKQRAERIVPECDPVVDFIDTPDDAVEEFARREKERTKLVRAITRLLTDDRKAVAAFIRRQNVMVNELFDNAGRHDAFVNDICKRIENPSLPLE